MKNFQHCMQARKNASFINWVQEELNFFYFTDAGVKKCTDPPKKGVKGSVRNQLPANEKPFLE